MEFENQPASEHEKALGMSTTSINKYIQDTSSVDASMMSSMSSNQRVAPGDLGLARLNTVMEEIDYRSKSHKRAMAAAQYRPN